MGLDGALSGGERQCAPDPVGGAPAGRRGQRCVRVFACRPVRIMQDEVQQAWRSKARVEGPAQGLVHEQVGGAVIGMLVSAVGHHDQGRTDRHNQRRQLVHEVLPPVHRAGNQLFGRRRGFARGVGRDEGEIRALGAGEQAQALVGVAKEANTRSADAQSVQRANRLSLADRPIPAVRRRTGMDTGVECGHALGKGVAAGHLDHSNRTAALNDALHQPAGGERRVVRMRRDDQGAYRLPPRESREVPRAHGQRHQDDGSAEANARAAQREARIARNSLTSK